MNDLQSARAARGEEVVKRLPPSIKVAAYTFIIVPWHSLVAGGNQRWGECSTLEQRISIQSNMPSPEKAIDTFLHEVLHAIYWAYGFDDADKEERIVGTLGTALTALHRDNPWLAGWLGEATAAA